jgi:hypothetical protein
MNAISADESKFLAAVWKKNLKTTQIVDAACGLGSGACQTTLVETGAMPVSSCMAITAHTSRRGEQA